MHLVVERAFFHEFGFAAQQEAGLQRKNKHQRQHRKGCCRWRFVCSCRSEPQSFQRIEVNVAVGAGVPLIVVLRCFGRGGEALEGERFGVKPSDGLRVLEGIVEREAGTL